MARSHTANPLVAMTWDPRNMFGQNYDTGVGALKEKIWEYFVLTDFVSNHTARRLNMELMIWARSKGYSCEDFRIAKAEVNRQYKRS